VNPALRSFEASCFDGQYITGDITPEYLDRLEYARHHPTKSVIEDATRTQLNLNYPAAE